ncbi:MAG TPA: radical SAM protein [Pyrinomonadaceae bacterium]|nr:radical SAM protein [Pyrinomonadaceae bacterium]
MQVTYQCNIECKHCGPYCGPKEYDWMTLDEMKDLIRQAGELGALNVVFTGGEPTLLGKDLITLLEFIRSETPITSTRMVTNGKWATSYLRAHRLAKSWKDAGLDELNISCGEYHQEFVPVEDVATAFKAARDLDFATVLLVGEFLQQGKGNYTAQMFKDAVGEDLLPPDLMSPYTNFCHGMSVGTAMNYGRGKEFVKEEDMILQPEEQIPSLCSDVLTAITVHPNGNTTACCGIMVRDESLLNIGNWRENRLRPMLEEAHQDIVLNWIRYVGLHDMKRWLKEKDPSLQFRDKYTNICDLCAEIVYNKRCQEVLNEFGHERADDIIANKVVMDATVYEPARFTYVEPASAEPASVEA